MLVAVRHVKFQVNLRPVSVSHVLAKESADDFAGDFPRDDRRELISLLISNESTTFSFTSILSRFRDISSQNRR